jgi:6-phosphogluconolactonase
MILQSFSSPTALAKAVAVRTAAILDQAIADRGRALLALSGGSTPKLYLPALDQAFAHWDKVEAFLTDERWVPTDHPDSNEALIRGILPRVRLTGLVNDAADPEAGLGETRQRLATLPEPWDLALLGMGEDGHIASLFPDTGAIDDPDPYCTAVLNAPLYPRLSLSAEALLRFSHRFLVISGKAKHEMLTTKKHGDRPVHWLLENAGGTELFYCP